MSYFSFATMLRCKGAPSSHLAFLAEQNISTYMYLLLGSFSWKMKWRSLQKSSYKKQQTVTTRNTKYNFWREPQYLVSGTKFIARIYLSRIYCTITKIAFHFYKKELRFEFLVQKYVYVVLKVSSPYTEWPAVLEILELFLNVIGTLNDLYCATFVEWDRKQHGDSSTSITEEREHLLWENTTRELPIPVALWDNINGELALPVTLHFLWDNINGELTLNVTLL